MSVGVFVSEQVAKIDRMVGPNLIFFINCYIWCINLRMKNFFRGTFIMSLQKWLYAAFPLVTMEKLFMLLRKANPSTCELHSSPHSRTLL